MKETLEETALRLSKDAYKKHSVKDDKLSLDEQIQRSGGFIVGFKEGMINGAKWQKEDMVEKLEMHILINEHDWSRNPQTQLKDFIKSLNK